MGQVLECLSSKHKALSLNPRTTKKKKNSANTAHPCYLHCRTFFSIALQSIHSIVIHFIFQSAGYHPVVDFTNWQSVWKTLV
jgi:hypothetical protein